MRLVTLVGLALFCTTLGAAPVRVSLNEKPLSAPALVRNGRVLLPFRAILNALNATVSYDARTHSVHAERGSERIALKVGQHASAMVAGHLYAPVRYVCESLGGRVRYDAVSRSVHITDARDGTLVARAPDPDPAATPAPAHNTPIPYATDDRSSGFAQSMNFYIPNDRYTYYPGERVEFVLDAPPGGSGYIDVCSAGRLQLSNPPGSTQYFANFVVPARFGGHACTATAYYYGALGARVRIALPNTIAFPAAAASPTPARTPSPKPTAPRAISRPISPVSRKPQSTAPPNVKAAPSAPPGKAAPQSK